MNLSNDLFLLMFNLSQLHNKKKIIELFGEGIQELFKPVEYRYIESTEKQHGSHFEIKTRNSSFGFIAAAFKGIKEKDYRVLMNNAVQMLAIILENLEYENNLIKERDSFEKISINKLIEVEKSISDLEEARRASINLIEDLTNEIEKRKQAEELIKKSEQKFRNLFEHSPVGKSMTSVDGTLNVNKSFCRILGYSEVELKAKNWKEISHPDDIDVTSQIVESLFKGEIISKRFEKRYIHKDGRTIFTDISTYLQRDSHGNPEFFITTINDITERKQLEREILKLNEELEIKVIERTRQLESVNKELEAFSYSVSHDLRAPLRAIHSFTSILKEDYGEILDTEGRRICGIIESSTTQMGRLIDDLLAFSRVGRTEMISSKIDIARLVKTVFLELTTEDERHRIHFEVKKLPSANGDIVTLKQVWVNLISNALKYTSKNENVSISVESEQSESELIYFIKDNGVGFDMHYVNKLFGVFQRLHSTKEFEGNGVGLAIIQRIVTRHGGRVWAEGEVGHGATFYFTLPVKK